MKSSQAENSIVEGTRVIKWGMGRGNLVEEKL